MAERSLEAVAWFEVIGLADRPSVGGKGASLGELERAHMLVPPGFVVTTAAFRCFIEASDPDARLRDVLASAPEADCAAPGAALRARIEATPLPPEIEEPFASAYERLCGAAENGMPVAVRSSATSEDSAGASFAGLQDTFLWVRDYAQVASALRRCWGSLYSDPAIAYRRRLALHEHDMAMGVVIQRMVEPRSAGVMFTRSPVTGDRSVVAICASWGLGSAVVGGDVTPDEFVVNKVTGQLARSTISRKALRHVPNLTGSGVREEPVPRDLQERAAVDEIEIRELTEVARRIEKHYGAPQDIEWAIDGAGAIFVLQSRPETVWSAREREAAEKGAADGGGAASKDKPFEHVLAFFGTRKP